MRDFKNKETLINVGLILLLVITIVICVIKIVTLPEGVVRDIFLVEDMNKGNSLVLDNSFYENVEKTEKGTLKYSASDKDILNPEDVLPNGGTGTNKNNKPNNSSIISFVDEDIAGVVNVVPESKNTEPLPIYGYDEVVEILETEEIEEEAPEIFSQSELDLLLSHAATDRNKGRDGIPVAFSIFNSNYSNIKLNSFKDKGCIIIPFDLTDRDLEYVKYFIGLYEKYKDDIYFVFMNRCRHQETIYTILDTLQKNGISTDIPIYMDGDYFFHVYTHDVEYRYVVLNYDNFVCASSTSYDRGINVDKIIEQLAKEKEFALEDNERVTQEYIDSLTPMSELIDGYYDGTYSSDEFD